MRSPTTAALTCADGCMRCYRWGSRTADLRRGSSRWIEQVGSWRSLRIRQRAEGQFKVSRTVPLSERCLQAGSNIPQGQRPSPLRLHCYVHISFKPWTPHPPNLTKSLLWRELEFGSWRSHPSRREGLTTTKVGVLAWAHPPKSDENSLCVFSSLEFLCHHSHHKNLRRPWSSWFLEVVTSPKSCISLLLQIFKECWRWFALGKLSVCAEGDKAQPPFTS
jgi:hypothetical protein